MWQPSWKSAEFARCTVCLAGAASGIAPAASAGGKKKPALEKNMPAFF
jgi:hypothetical protein